MSRTRLAVNWFNYPICLWQAWFQLNCSSCGRRWQTAMWRRRTARPITVTGVWTCRPPPPFPPKTTTSMDPPTASTSATHSRERGKTAQTLSHCWRKVPLHCWSLTQKSEHSLRQIDGQVPTGHFLHMNSNLSLLSTLAFSLRTRPVCLVLFIRDFQLNTWENGTVRTVRLL